MCSDITLPYSLNNNLTFIQEESVGSTIPIDPSVEFEQCKAERDKELENIHPDESKRLDIIPIIDKPENLQCEFLKEEQARINQINESIISSLQNIQESKKQEDIKQKAKKYSNSKVCYTCKPRKKILEHIIEKNEIVTFHHDICGRNMIIMTPNEHFSSLDKSIDSYYIGELFKQVTNFCLKWNITDYSTTFNQGNWQNHSHFHIKIKTYENIIKRMRGDHFRLLNLQKEYE